MSCKPDVNRWLGERRRAFLGGSSGPAHHRHWCSLPFCRLGRTSGFVQKSCARPAKPTISQMFFPYCLCVCPPYWPWSWGHLAHIHPHPIYLIWGFASSL